MLLLIDQSLKSLMDHLRINSSTDVGSMIVSEAGQGHVDKLRELFKVHPDKVGNIKIIGQAPVVQRGNNFIHWTGRYPADEMCAKFSPYPYLTIRL